MERLRSLSGLKQGGLGALAFHRDGYLVGHRFQQVQLLLGQTRARARAEGEGAHHAALCDQRKGGIGLDAEGPHQGRPGIIRMLALFG